MARYPEYKALNLPDIDKQILSFWKEKGIFEQSVTSREGATPFVFYEGPPSANGMPGIHHVLSRTIKDLFCRFKTLQGYQVKRKAGWDTHGLPVELQVEKMLGITKDDIGKPGGVTVEEYNAKCRSEVMRFKDAWEDLTDKMGYWVDMTDPYVTYDNNYIESLWYLLKQLYINDLLYEGFTIQPYSPAAGTGLSTHELNMPGCYKMVKDLSLVAQFKVVKDEKSTFLFENIETDNRPANEDIGDVYFLAWTTTPWTLPSNSALAVGENIEYVLIKTSNSYTNIPINVILAKDAVSKYFNIYEEEKQAFEAGNRIVISGGKKADFQKLDKFKGKQLEGLHYEQLMPYVNPPAGGRAFEVVIGDFVSTEDGTGIVHIAPTFGSDDFRVAKKYGIVPMMVTDADGKRVPLVDTRGRFVKEVTDFAGEYVKEDYLTAEEKETERKKQGRDKYLNVDERISIKLKEENKCFKTERHDHSYPHCWRTDKPVLYYPLDSWFIRTTAAKERMVELNKTINWKPEFTGSGRFGNWLENLQDWNLSRSRYWGTPLPIWKDVFTRDLIVIGSKSDFFGIRANNVFAFKLNRGDFEEFYIKLLSNDSDIIDKIRDAFLREVPGQENFFANLLNTLQHSKYEFFLNAPSIILSNFFVRLSEEDVRLMDLHKPFIDDIFFMNTDVNGSFLPLTSKQRLVFERTPDLIDVWFDSGAMPYAQWHYPFENKELIEEKKFYPADFIAEGVDQTRGWFFTLHAIAVMLFDTVAFKNVVSNGLVLDKNGNKMSKRLGNTVEPFEAIAKNGADAVRWYMLSNSQPWDNLKFDIEGIDEVKRKFFGTLYNTYSFFALYANVDSFTVDQNNLTPIEERSESDRWIISKLHSLIKDITAFYNDYEPTQAARAMEEFVDEHLSNWYVRLNRRRFWKGEMSPDKKAAYETLHQCLLTLSQLMSPLAPFFGDWLYRNLMAGIIENNRDTKLESVHLTHLYKANETLIDAELETMMQLAQDISSLTLSLRKKVNIKVRQPLQKILIPILSEAVKQRIEHVRDIILAEVNIKEIEYVHDTSGLVTKKVKPDFKKLGAKLGKMMKMANEILQNLDQNAISQLETHKNLDITVDGEVVNINLDEVEIVSHDIEGWTVANKNGLIVALDVHLTAALEQEGVARELINRIQNIRKDQAFNITDRISVSIENKDFIAETLNSFKNYICTEVLATDIALALQPANAVEVEINDMPIKISVNKN